MELKQHLPDRVDAAARKLARLSGEPVTRASLAVAMVSAVFWNNPTHAAALAVGEAHQLVARNGAGEPVLTGDGALVVMGAVNATDWGCLTGFSSAARVMAGVPGATSPDVVARELVRITMAPRPSLKLNRHEGAFMGAASASRLAVVGVSGSLTVEGLMFILDTMTGGATDGK